jgi:hypothetical protein
MATAFCRLNVVNRRSCDRICRITHIYFNGLGMFPFLYIKTKFQLDLSTPAKRAPQRWRRRGWVSPSQELGWAVGKKAGEGWLFWDSEEDIVIYCTTEETNE